jgi:hypothetical protein
VQPPPPTPPPTPTPPFNKTTATGGGGDERERPHCTTKRTLPVRMCHRVCPPPKPTAPLTRGCDRGGGLRRGGVNRARGGGWPTGARGEDGQHRLRQQHQGPRVRAAGVARRVQPPKRLELYQVQLGQGGQHEPAHAVHEPGQVHRGSCHTPHTGRGARRPQHRHRRPRVRSVHGEGVTASVLVSHPGRLA